MRKTNAFYTLLDTVNEILDECIEIRKNLTKINSKINHQIYKIGRDYNLINNNLLFTKDMITNRSKLIVLKRQEEELTKELRDKGHINIIFN